MQPVTWNRAAPVIVVGTDDGMFLMACLLAESVRQWAREFPFYMLDFGRAMPPERPTESAQTSSSVPLN